MNCTGGYLVKPAYYNFREDPSVKEILSKTLTGKYLLNSPHVEIISLTKAGSGYDEYGDEVYNDSRNVSALYLTKRFFYKVEWRSEISGRKLFEVFNI